MFDNKSTLQKILIFFSPYFFLDGVELLGRAFNPEALGRFSCFILPFLKPASLFIPHELVEFAVGQCAANPQEPAMSIIFFMLKIIISIVVGVILAFHSMLIMGTAAHVKKMKERVRQLPYAEGSFGEIKYNCLIIFGCILLSLLLFNNLGQKLNNLYFTPINKIKEDLSSLVILVITSLIVRDFLIMTYLGLRIRR